MTMSCKYNKIILNDADRIVTPYSWVGHIPFAFWLIDEMRPASFVELGTHTGNSYFSFCQAVKHSGSETQCYAIDTWQGDEHAGFYDRDIYDDVNTYNEINFSNFSSLYVMTFDEAVTKFADGSIDLLHIDGLHTYEAVKHDFELWLPKLSDKGVVLFHDTTVKDLDFGVWKLWAELENEYKAFEFKHSHGLGVLLVGIEVPEPVIELYEAIKGGGCELENLFETIGNGAVNKLKADQLSSVEKSYDDAVREREKAFEEKNIAIVKMNNAIEEKERAIHMYEDIISSLSWRLTSPVRKLRRLISNSWTQ